MEKFIGLLQQAQALSFQGTKLLPPSHGAAAPAGYRCAKTGGKIE